MKIKSKHIAGYISLMLFMAFSASLAYWSTQWLKPNQRVVAAPMSTPMQQLDPSMAASLFGGERLTMATAGNFQLMGVVAAKNDVDSVAIVSADGKPARALRVGVEVQSGTRIREIHPAYIILSIGGVSQRVELPQKTRIVAASPVVAQRTVSD